MVVQVIDLAFGEDDQRMGGGGQGGDRLAKGAEIAALAVDAKTTMLAIGDLLPAGHHLEDLPGGHDVGGPGQAGEGLQQQVAVGVAGVVGRDQHPLPRPDSPPDVL